MDAFIATYCDVEVELGKRDEALNAVSTYCSQNGVDGLITLVKTTFGPHLTNVNSKVRQAAIHMLVKCCESVLAKYLDGGKKDDDKLPKEKAQFLINFLIDRIDDYDSVGGALNGLLIFLKFESGLYIDSKLLLDTFSKVNGKLNVPAMFQEWRQTALSMFEVAFTNKLYVDYIREEKRIDEFANGFKSSMWHEKDPRCLLIGFRAAKFLLYQFADDEEDSENESEKYSLHDETLESIFDATSCYFPITFKPPPNDPYGIRPEVLIRLLEEIFASSPRLAKHVFPFFLEKMDADLTEAKVHSMNAWSACIENFSINDMAEYMTPQLTSLLVEEILRSNDDDTVPTALNFMKLLVRISVVASNSSGRKKESVSSKRQKTSTSPVWSNFINAVLKASVVELCGAPEAMVGRSAARMLQAFAAASPTSFLVAIKRALPPFLDFHDETSNESQKDAIIEAVALITDIIDKEVAYFDGEKEVVTVLDSMKDLFWKSYLSSENDQDQRKRVCLLAISNLIVRPPTSYINSPEVKAIIRQLGKDVLSGGNSQLIDRTIVQVLIDVCCKNQGYTTSLVDEVLPGYVDNVKNRLDAADKEDHRGNEIMLVSLQVLANLCAIPAVYRFTLPSLYNICRQSMWQEKEGCIIFSCLTRIILHKSNDADSINYCFSSSSFSGKTDSAISFTQVLLDDFYAYGLACQHPAESICKRNIELCYRKIFTTLTQQAPEGEHNNFVTKVLNLYISNKLPVNILVAVVGSCRRKVLTEEPVNVPLLAQNLLDICITGTSVHSNKGYLEAAAKSLASLMNKVGTQNDEIIETCTTFLVDTIKDTSSQHHIYTLSWFTKALVMRGHTRANDLIELLFEALKSKHTGVANMAARSFSVVMEDSEDVLNKKCNIRSTIFYKQRFFEHVFPMLNNTLKMRDDEIRPYIVKSDYVFGKHTTASTLLAHADSFAPCTRSNII